MTPLIALLLAASPVEVVADPCVGVSSAEVQRIATAELSGSHLSPASIRVQLSCHDDTVEVRVDDAITRKSLLRSIDLRPLAESTRERYVALAIAELVAASWSELLLPERRVLPTGLAPSRAERAAAIEALPTHRFQVVAAGMGRAYPRPGMLMAGASLRLQYTAPGQLGFAFDFAGAHGSSRLEEGTLQADLLDGAAFLMWAAPQRFLGATAGAGVRAGGARLQGTPADPARYRGSSIAGALAGPCAMGQLSVGSGGAAATLGLELGIPMWRLHGSVAGETAFRLEGLWLSASLGAAFEL